MGTSLRTSARELRYLPPPPLAGLRDPAWKGALLGVLLAHVLLARITEPVWAWSCGTWAYSGALGNGLFVSLLAAAGGAIGSRLRGLAWRPVGILAGSSLAVLWFDRRGYELVVLFGTVALCSWVAARLVPWIGRRRPARPTRRPTEPRTGARAHLAIAIRSRASLVGTVAMLLSLHLHHRAINELSMHPEDLVLIVGAGYTLGLLVALGFSYAGYRGRAGRPRAGGGDSLAAR